MITALELIGNWKNGPRYKYHQDDIDLLTNSRAIDKIHRLFEKTKFNFNIRFVRNYKASRYVQYGIASPDWVNENLGIKYTPQDDAINVIFTNNVGIKHLPFTSWMIAHRIGHVIMENHRYFWSQYNADLKRFLSYYNLSYPSLYNSYVPKGIFNQICTMKSARQHNILNQYEAFHEMIAQFIMTGSIKLAKPTERLITNYSYAWGHPNHKYAYLRKDCLNVVEDMMSSFSILWQDMVENILIGLEGSTLVM